MTSPLFFWSLSFMVTPIFPHRPGSICISTLQPQELGWCNQSSRHPTISQEPAALRTQEVPQPGLQVRIVRSVLKHIFLHIYKVSFSSSALSTKWIQSSSRVQPSQMPVPATCWTTVSWRATAPPEDRRRAPLCPVGSHSASVNPVFVHARSSVWTVRLPPHDFVSVFREQRGLRTQRGDVLAGFWKVFSPFLWRNLSVTNVIIRFFKAGAKLSAMKTHPRPAQHRFPPCSRARHASSVHCCFQPAEVTKMFQPLQQPEMCFLLNPSSCSPPVWADIKSPAHPIWHKPLPL